MDARTISGKSGRAHQFNVAPTVSYSSTRPGLCTKGVTRSMGGMYESQLYNKVWYHTIICMGDEERTEQ